MKINLHIYRCFVTFFIISFSVCAQQKHITGPGLCDSSAQISLTLTTLTDHPLFIQAKKTLNSAGADGLEHSIMFGKDTSGRIVVSPVSSGTKNSSSVNAGFPGAFADLHNHPENTVHSAGDLYNLISMCGRLRQFKIRMVLLANGALYALVMLNEEAAAKFLDAYPPEHTEGFSPRFPEKLFLEFAALKSFLINIQNYDRVEADETATAVILNNYNVGLGLFRYDNKQGFSRIIVIEEMTADGTRNYRTKSCN